MTQPVLLWVSAVGGIGTLITMLIIACRVGAWKGQIAARIDALEARLVRQNHTDEAMEKLVALAVADAATQRQMVEDRLRLEIARVEARLDELARRNSAR